MTAMNCEIRINMYTPDILPPPPLVRQNAMTPEQWAEIDRLIKTRHIFVPVPPTKAPAPSPAVIYEDSDDESTCTNEWDIEKGRF
jgi:hypothetical protein